MSTCLQMTNLGLAGVCHAADGWSRSFTFPLQFIYPLVALRIIYFISLFSRIHDVDWYLKIIIVVNVCMLKMVSWTSCFVIFIFKHVLLQISSSFPVPRFSTGAQGHGHVNTNGRIDQRQLHNATLIFFKFAWKGANDHYSKITPSGQEISRNDPSSLKIVAKGRNQELVVIKPMRFIKNVCQQQ